MNVMFRNFALASALIVTAACAVEDEGMMGEMMDEGMMSEEMMMMEEGGMLSDSEIGDDEFANLTIAKMDSAEAVAEFMATNGFDRVYFDTDRSGLYWRSENALKAQARLLEANPDLQIVIEGHADERGTDEYNLALGERRANSAREYLVSQNVDPFRIEVVSFGEERPIETCSDESCWSQNRRAVVTLKSLSSSDEEADFEDEDDDFDLGF